MKDLVLVGAGGHCKSCIDAILSEGKYSIAGILDIPEKVGQNVLGYTVIGTDADIPKYAHSHHFLITLGQIETPNIRIKLFEKIKQHQGKLATVISPRAYVSKHASIGEGTIIMADAFVNAGATIGKNCIINTKALIEHDCIIEDNCHIAISANLAGEVLVQKNSFVGANATIVQNVTIKSNAFIKASQLVKE